MQSSGTELPPADLPRDEYERRLPAETSFQRWVLFEANRWALIVPLLIGVFAMFFALDRFGIVVFRNEYTASILLSVFIGGNFTLITIVLTINQLVLSREFGKPHTLRERNEGIERFREDLVSTLDEDVGAADPLDLLRGVVHVLGVRAEELRAAVSDAPDPTLRGEVAAYADAVLDETAAVDDVFAESQFGDFDVLTAMLFYRIAWQIHATRRLRREFADTLPDRADATLRELEDALRNFNMARQYVQTLYMQKELAELSRLLLYVGLPSLLFLSVLMLVYELGPGVTIGADGLAIAFSAAGTAAFAPLSILFAYVIRVSTIVSRMPFLSPFIVDG